MRIIFMGTPGFAVPALLALHAAGHDIAAVYTRAPKPAGRGKREQRSAVHEQALALGLPVRTPRTLRDAEAQAELAALAADVAIVAAYGLILPQAVLDMPARGCINIHASLLPRWRGAAPIQRAILAGDATTGVTIMQMAAGLDTGPMLAAAATDIAGKTAGALTTELANMGAQLLLDVLANPPAPVPQPDDGTTYAAKIDKAESWLDCALPATELVRRVQAFNPAPGAWLHIAGERVKVLAAEAVPGTGVAAETWDDRLTIGTAAGGLRPLLLQRAGKPAVPLAALLNGWRVPAGTRIS